MKKCLLFIPFMLLGLSGCNPKNSDSVNPSNGNTQATNQSAQTTKGKVQLSAENYTTYIAINTSIALPNAGYSDVIYYSYFIGSSYCKFIDCKLTYKYVLNGGSNESSPVTVPLTLSGDGQAEPFYARALNRGNYYAIVITGASGTVQIL